MVMAGMTKWWLRFRLYIALAMAGLYIAALARLLAGDDPHDRTSVLTLDAICTVIILLMFVAMTQVKVEVTGWRSRPAARWVVVLLVGGLDLAGVITEIVTVLDHGYLLCQMSTMALALSWISGTLPSRSQGSSSQQPITG